MFHHVPRKLNGFTLLETMIVLGIFVLLVVGVGSLTVSVFRYNRSLVNSLDAEQSIERTFVRLTKELRTASPSSLGAYSIETGTATSLTFYANIDSDTYKERLRYFMNGTSLQRGVLKPTGNPLVYNGANEQVATMVQNVTNADIFTYYDQNYDGTSAALAFPITTTNVRLIKVRIVTDRDPVSAPAPFEGVTSIEVRNLKAN